MFIYVLGPAHGPQKIGMSGTLTIDHMHRWSRDWYDLRTRADAVRALLICAARGPLTVEQSYQLQSELEAIRAVACDPILNVLFLPSNEFHEEGARQMERSCSR